MAKTLQTTGLFGVKKNELSLGIGQDKKAYVQVKGENVGEGVDVQQIVDDFLASNPPQVTETDPTVPDWAKQPQKPTYTADEVHALPDTYTPPDQTAQQVGADPAGTAATAVSQHNTDTAAHNDIRLTLQELANRVNAALDSDDTTLDQMSEVVAYIKSNKSLIDAITTSKVSVGDIINDLVTNVADKPLSAAQGVALKGLVDELRTLIPETYTLPMATETTLGGVKPVTATDAMTQPVGVTEDGRLVTKPGEGSGISVTGATVGQTIRVAAVDDDGVPTAWEAVDFPDGSGGTKTEEATVNISVGTESVTLDETAPEQTVNLTWNVPGSKVIPAFTNYYIEMSGRTYPFELGTGYNQFWSISAGHGNSDAFVSGHQYFTAMKFELDGESTVNYSTSGKYISPTNSATLSGTGWLYDLFTPTNAGQSSYFLSKLSGTGRIYYLYCIDITELQEAGTITATTVSELAELFGELPLIPGQDFEGATTSGEATLSINRDGEVTEISLGTATASVKGGDILVMDTGIVTFVLTVLKTVSVDTAKQWEGIKWIASGDSLTDESINADKKYYRYIEEKTGITVVVMGKGGTGYYRGYSDGTAYGQRMANVPADADIITIFGSVNDWHIKSDNVEAGSASDTVDAGTLAGYINECIDVAIEKAPYAQIALVTPMDYHGLPDDTLESIVSTIKAVANYRKIKCLDLYHESGFRVDNPTFAMQFTTDYSETADSYGHPNNLAHEKIIAPEFMELLKRMILTE